MKCPWCHRDIGYLLPTKYDPAICTFCGGKVASVFHLRTVLLCGVLTVVPTWFMAPMVGDGVWLVAFVLPFIAGMRLQKWY
jgi:hypothetical protein